MKGIAVYPLFHLLFFLSFLFQLSCNDGLDDNYTTDRQYRLDFSRDTVSFDTVFTTVGSATQNLMVYNRNRKPLEIERVWLGSGGTSGFYVNVDGKKGVSFDHIGIQEGDSLYVFMEVNVNPSDAKNPLLVEDSLMFLLGSGVMQVVRLEAYGQNVHIYRGKTFVSDTVLTADLPYLVYDSLVVAEDVTVTVEENTTFYMHDHAKVEVYGTLLLNGEREKPVVFRGDRNDDIIDNILPYDHTPGQWGGIRFRSGSMGNRFDYAVIRNGTDGIRLDDSGALSGRKLEISNSQITNMSRNLLLSYNNDIRAVNTEFSNAGYGVAVLVGGEISFVHCSFVNYMVLLSRNFILDGLEEKYTSCVTLANYKEDGMDAGGAYPLDVSFDNCIIDGSLSAGSGDGSGELMLLYRDGSAFNYRFNHCFLKTEEKDSGNFQGVLYGDSPEYKVCGDEESRYWYDFRLKSDSTVGVGAADPEISRLYPVDRYGISRMTSEYGPSIGAYEYVP